MGEPKIRSVGVVDVTFGENVTIVEPVNLYGCVIGDEQLNRPLRRNPAWGRHWKTLSDPIARFYL